MKGTVGFLVGIIGFCFFAAVSFLPMILFRREAPVISVIIAIVAVIFFMIMVVGFYCLISGLHDTVLYPDDPYSQPLCGRGLFFTGCIGLLVTVTCPVLLLVLRGFQIRREMDVVLVIAWPVAWAFAACLLGGVLMLLHDIHHKAFYRTMAPPRDRYDDDFDISRRGPRRRPRRAEDEDERPRQRQWEE